MLDPDDPGACGRCHEGSPAHPGDVAHPAPGAPACSTCHAEPGGPLACTTCHGSGPGKAYPAGTHAAHVEPSKANAAGIACATCHPMPGAAAVIGGSHGNGSVDVVFDVKRTGAEASWDAAKQACAVGCHDQGGTRPRPTWSDTVPIACGDCHGAPPARHYPGVCTTCHREANATGTALAGGPMHMNGQVDLGDGSAKCGACHGGDPNDRGNPLPATDAHGAHANPTLTVPVACGDCHAVPQDIHAPGHMDGRVGVTLAGRALDRSSVPTYDAAASSCAGVACHGAGLVDPPAIVPAWRDTSGAASACGACHPTPPSMHTPSTSCDRSVCHGAEVRRANGVLSITDFGKSLHVNGVTDVVQ
jgi:predicted CxxxxCH...CXXCH cytochrome family protein